jgi:transcriptional antiterminator NusG
MGGLMNKDKKTKKEQAEEAVEVKAEEIGEDLIEDQSAVVIEENSQSVEADLDAEEEAEESAVEDHTSDEDGLEENVTEEDLIDGDKDLKATTIKQTGERGWYVIHSYAGYEDQVAEQLKQRVETLGMKDKIFNVLVPKEKQIEIKNGKRRTVERRIFPGYVMVEMIVTDESWYVVRNTPNVTGFIGMGVRPTPMLPDEVDRIMKRMGVQESKYKIELNPDDLVKIVDGPLKGFEGKVTEVDEDKGKVKVSVNMFGRETPVNLDSLQVKKV